MCALDAGNHAAHLRLQLWFATPLHRELAPLQALARLPDENTTRRFRHRLQAHKVGGSTLTTVNEVLSAHGPLFTVGVVVERKALRQGEEEVAFGDAGDQGLDKRADARSGAPWRMAMRAGLRKPLDKADPVDARVHTVEYHKDRVRAKVEHPAPVLKRWFGCVKVRCR